MKNKTNEVISNIMSKRHGILPKTLSPFFKMEERLGRYRNSNLANFRKPSF